MSHPSIFNANLQVREIDTASGEAEEEGYDDEYQLEDVEVRTRVSVFLLLCGRFLIASQRH